MGRKVRLRALASSIREAMPGSERPYVALEHVQSGTGRFVEGFQPETTTTQGEILFQAGDVLFGKLRAYLAKVINSKFAGAASGEFIVMRPNDSVESRFLYYLSLSRPFLDWAVATSVGTKMPRTDWEQLSEFPLDLPQLPEQRQIAYHLDRETARISSSIAALGRLRNVALERARTIVDQTILAFPRRVPLKRVIDFKEGPGIMAEDFRNEGVPLIRIGGLKDGRVTVEGCSFVSPGMFFQRWRQFELAEGDYVLSASASMGLISRVGQEATGAIPYTGLIRLRPRGSEVEMEYAKFFFSSRAFSDQVEVLRTGVGIEHYGPAHLSRMWMPLPSISEQRIVGDELDSLTETTTTLANSIGKEIQLLEERRQSVITGAVTGPVGSPSEAI